MKHEELVRMIIDTLYEKKGFDDWWDSIDEEIQEEIIEELQQNVSEFDE